MSHSNLALPSLFSQFEPSNWQWTLRKNGNLKFIRDIFKRKQKKKLSFRHMSVFLCSSEFAPKIQNSKVSEKIDKLAVDLMSSRKMHKLWKLAPPRKFKSLKDCYTLETEPSDLIFRIFEIFHFFDHIGAENCEKIATWTLDTVAGKKTRPPILVMKHVSTFRAFRAKSVLISESIASKRGIQLSIFANFTAALCWWTLAAFRQVLLPVPIQGRHVVFWRRGYLKMLKIEMADFRRRYHVRRLTLSEKIQTASTAGHRPIGPLKFAVVRRQLRPVFPKTMTTRISRVQQVLHWKRVNSMLNWLFEVENIGKMSIRENCEKMYRFLRKNEADRRVSGFTVDVTKCFSTVDHHILVSLLESIIDKNATAIFSIRGFGRDEHNRYKDVCCSASTEHRAHEMLREKMAARRVAEYRKTRIEKTSSKWLLDELRTTIRSYFYRRGQKTWKVTRGVPQGHPLSSHLAHLYLAAFETDYWRGTAEKRGESTDYCRYEDDFLICTTEEATVKKMLDPLFSGLNTYNLVANRSKTQISSRHLSWCGVEIDLKRAKFATRRKCSDGKYRFLPIKFQ